MHSHNDLYYPTGLLIEIYDPIIIEQELAALLSEEIAKEIDREILSNLLNNF